MKWRSRCYLITTYTDIDVNFYLPEMFICILTYKPNNYANAHQQLPVIDNIKNIFILFRHFSHMKTFVAIKFSRKVNTIDFLLSILLCNKYLIIYFRSKTRTQLLNISLQSDKLQCQILWNYNKCKYLLEMNLQQPILSV